MYEPQAAPRRPSVNAGKLWSGGLATALAVASRRHRIAGHALDLSPVSHWSEPDLAVEPDPHRPGLC